MDPTLCFGASEPGTGGQYVAHEPLQAECPRESFAKAYRVICCGSTSTLPKAVDPTETAPDDVGLCPPDDEEVLPPEPLPPEPQAASRSSPAPASPARAVDDEWVRIVLSFS